MGMKNNRTICSKHDEIKTLSDGISSTLEAVIRSLKGQIDDGIIDRLGELKLCADDIYTLAEDAKEDGQDMESGLSDKKTQIEKLEDRVDELEEFVAELEDEVKELKQD